MEKKIVSVPTDTMMMDKMKLAKLVHTNAQTVPLTDVLLVPKTELTQNQDVHVMVDIMKMEMLSAHLAHTDVKLATMATIV